MSHTTPTTTTAAAAATPDVVATSRAAYATALRLWDDWSDASRAELARANDAHRLAVEAYAAVAEEVLHKQHRSPYGALRAVTEWRRVQGGPVVCRTAKYFPGQPLVWRQWQGPVVGPAEWD